MRKYTLSSEESQGAFKIVDLLGRGESEAKTLKELQAATGLKSRELRQRIQAERLAGEPILSAMCGRDGGYFLAGNAAEAKQFYESMQRRAFEIRRVAGIVYLAAVGEEATNAGV